MNIFDRLLNSLPEDFWLYIAIYIILGLFVGTFIWLRGEGWSRSEMFKLTVHSTTPLHTPLPKSNKKRKTNNLLRLIGFTWMVSAFLVLGYILYICKVC